MKSNKKFLYSNTEMKTPNSKQIEALVRLLFHHLYLEFICYLGFVVCNFKKKV